MSWDEGLEGPPLEIARTDHTPLRVMAGPGTGKTFALMRRIARLLEEEEIDPSRGLLVTFTRTTAADLVKELSQLNVSGADQLKAGTLHSFCFSILNRARVLAITGRNPRPLLEYEKRFMLEDLKQLELGGIRELRKKLQAFEAAWARLQSEEPGWPQNAEDRSFQQELKNWLLFHEAILIDELVPETLRYLRDNPASPERDMYNYLFVDEYQDLNKAEQKLLDILSENGSIMIIGDEDQSIYESFRYAHPEGIANYANEHPETLDIQLNECRRCPKGVVELANQLIQNNEFRSCHTTLNLRTENNDGEINVVQWVTMDDETNGLAQFIKKKIDDGIVNAGKVLVLCPRRQFGYRIRDKLREIGINVHSFFHEEALEGNPKILEKAKAQEAFTLLTLLSNQNDRVALRCWLGFGSTNLRAGSYQRFRSFCESNRDTPIDILEEIPNDNLTLPHRRFLIPRYEQLIQKLEELEGLRGWELINQLFPEGESWAKIFRDLLENIDDNALPSDILQNLRTNITQPEMPTDVDYVRIMSLHRSKGLTADLVVICGCIDGLVPTIEEGLSGDEHERNLEEQRRLFYVGITRTKDILVLSSILRLPLDLAYQMRARVIPIGRTDSMTISSPFLSDLGPNLPQPIRGDEWIN
jgi:DNA helicase-2/ATP-dependent DNA helicase PcrA